MKCPKCHFDNKEEASFCKKCGTKLEFACPSCGHPYEEDSLFCEQCGERLKETVAEEREVPEAEGERKHVTVLFSDLSGYTAMSEKLDPEELKEITTDIFSQISKVINKYEGFVEKFVGDAVMAIFGVPKAHEDDPIRAIWAARDIHELVDSMSPEVEKTVGKPISMHTGINTGLVVTGEVDMGKGTHGVAGDTINLASRLSSLANEGEVLVGPDTYRQAEGHFTFESLEPTTVKGKEEPIQVHKVLSAKERPVKLHRLSGLRADLIGRKAEIAQLDEAVENLRKGNGSIFSIYGDAGTGKSRLIDEFKTSLDLQKIQWLDGYAYAYAQNIPYFPFIDLVSRLFQIEERDPAEKVRDKVEVGVKALIGNKSGIVPYVGNLYALNYPEVEDVSPEYWKSQLLDAVLSILSALAQKAPTIFCLEDLHWADPSFVELLRNALLHIRQPAIVLCVYRPIFNLFKTHQLGRIGKIYREIQLHDLSPSEAQDMMESLLKTDTIPADLKRFVRDKAEGNPFYLEEVVNSLIESETLIQDNGSWKIARPISEADISSTVHGVISSRLDRLEKEAKRILQEASVIGRAFLYEILRRITEIKQETERCLRGLEQLDLIRTKSLQPDLEYIFKHALTQEVAYNGLLRKERKAIHERIALVMEQLFEDRLSEFYETLAFHFARGQSPLKAVHYLTKSGEKSRARYSLEESHQYFKDAFDILSTMTAQTGEEQHQLIDLIIKWAKVYNFRGDFKGLTELMTAYRKLAESLEEKEKLGMYYGWLGHALKQREKLRDGYQFLCKALKLGEEIDNNRVIGYACSWLAWACSDLGLLDDAIVFGKRAQEICGHYRSDRSLFRFSHSGLAFAYCFRGESKKAEETGRLLLEYGQSESDIRSTFLGHYYVGLGHYSGGDFPLAIEHIQKAIEVSADPLFSYGAKTTLGLIFVSRGEIDKAGHILEEVIKFSENFGFETIGTVAQILLGVVTLTKGNLSKGLKILKDLSGILLRNESMWRYATLHYMLGNFYSTLAQRTGPKSVSLLAKNIGFLIKNVPLASKKAQTHFNEVITVAKKIGANSVLGQAHLDIGLMYKKKGRTDMAQENISKAVQLFEKCEAETYLTQAKEALVSLG
jgi:predicted ATPase/class 3 adenylate cyclase